MSCSEQLSCCLPSRRCLVLPFAACLTAVLAAGPVAGRVYAKETVPDWVRSAATEKTETLSPDAPAVVLLDETVLTVDNDGRAVEHHRHVVKILRAKGREEGILHVGFDADEKILSLHVWSIAPDGREYGMKDKEIGEVGYPGSGNLYEDRRMRVAEPPALDPGAVVAWEYEQRIAPYMHEATWFFQDDIPHLNQSYTLNLPAGYSYSAVWAHHAADNAIDLEHNRTRWELASTPAIDLERVPMAPTMIGLMGRMTVHFAPTGQTAAPLGSWQAVGAFYDQLARDRMVSTPGIAAKAAELTAGKADFFDKTEAIAEFVQKDIRYFVIEKGIGGRQPHAADEIFRNRYGDCKDKSTLLSAMLSSVGIRSLMVLVDSERGFVDPTAPSVLGDHAIAAVEIPVGYQSPKLHSVVTLKSGQRFLIVDPTSEKTAFGQVEHNLQGGYALLVEPAGGEMVQIPVLDPDLNTISLTGRWQLELDGTLKGAVVEKSFGDQSEFTRYLYAYGDAKMRSSYLNRSLGNDLNSFTVSDVKVDNLMALGKDVVQSFQLSADHYSTTGGLLMVRPRVLGREAMSLDHKARTIPIDLDQTMSHRDDFSIQLPAGYAVDELPEPVKLDVGFASYESSTRMDGDTLHYTRPYTVREVSLPADRYGDLEKLAETIEADEQNRAVLKKKP